MYWRAPLDRLHEAGIEVQLLHAHRVRQLRGRKTDIEDSRWLARVCQFGPGRPSMVPDRECHRQRLVQERSRVRNRIQKVIDGAGVRVGGILSDVPAGPTFGVSPNARGVALPDPDGPHLECTTVKVLAETGKVDAIINFPLNMAINSIVIKKPCISQNWINLLDKFFGACE